MDQYKNSMAEIKVNRIDVQALLRKRDSNLKKGRTFKLIPIPILFILLLLPYLIAQKSSDIAITVYAAENNVPISKDYIQYELTAEPLIGSSDIDDQGNYINSLVDYNLKLLCKGEDIKEITYTCNDQEVTRNNRYKATAYYVENTTMPVEEYRNLNLSSFDNFLFGYYGEGEDTAKVTKLIGNSYTVAYEDQESKQYGLVLAATVDQDGKYQVKDIIIKLDITMKNGSVQHRKLQVKPVKDAFSEVLIRVL